VKMNTKSVLVVLAVVFAILYLSGKFHFSSKFETDPSESGML
jgi:hypothetical protein